MRVDEAKFRIHCRTRSRLHLGQIRPQRLGSRENHNILYISKAPRPMPKNIRLAAPVR